METTDKTFIEMQQQMQQLRDKLESQRIVNDRLLRNACRHNINRLRIKSSVPVIAGFAGLALIPFLKEVGFSVWFLIVTGLLLLTAMGLTMYVKRFIPRVDGNLVSAAEDVARFRKINTDWIKFGIPALVVWIALFILDAWKYNPVIGENILPLVGGAGVGLIVGLLLGLKNRRDILRASDDLLSQIGELRQE
ncbi:MAG: hypothetical protein IKH60_07030 [Bacteroidales bacterium]|nr:hypothetical protein [Bacteroidales bacterium]